MSKKAKNKAAATKDPQSIAAKVKINLLINIYIITPLNPNYLKP